MSRVLVMGDLHAPANRTDYFAFLKETYDDWGCDRMVSIGDLLDFHSISYHETDPDGASAADELSDGQAVLSQLYDIFPEGSLILGNHDRLPARKMYTMGLPSQLMKSWKEVFEMPEGWDVHDHLVIDQTLYVHGVNGGGDSGWQRACLNNQCSTVMGHYHSIAGVRYVQTMQGRLFSMCVGCGIDEEAYNFMYARYNPKKPVLSCGIVEDGKRAYVIPMD